MPHIERLIVSTINRGNGNSFDSPIRNVIQIHREDGELVAENDPNGGFTLEQMVMVAKFVAEKQLSCTDGHWHTLIKEALNDPIIPGYSF